MKIFYAVLSFMIVVFLTFGCSYKSSSGEYSIGDGGLVFTESAALTVKVEGNSNLTEISHFILEKDDEEEYLQDYSTNSAGSAIDGKFKENVKSFSLPWNMELILDADEILYIQVKPIDFNGKVVVEVWRDGNLQKEYSINNNMSAFWTSYRL